MLFELLNVGVLYINKSKLLPPCTYQGGKQRIAMEIVNIILRNTQDVANVHFYDLCCGSGAITVELLSRGIKPTQIVMCDKSSWGAFWKAIGDGTFEKQKFYAYTKQVPHEQTLVQQYIVELAKESADIDEVYKYILLQATSFGGKQVYRIGDKWQNAFFRAYWQPTETSKRRSPVNAMQPSVDKLEARVNKLVDVCKGLKVYDSDIYNMLSVIRADKAAKVIYIDPSYRNTTGYGYNFDYQCFIKCVKQIADIPIYVSETVSLTDNSYNLRFAGAKGGISGKRTIEHSEYLSVF